MPDGSARGKPRRRRRGRFRATRVRTRKGGISYQFGCRTVRLGEMGHHQLKRSIHEAMADYLPGQSGGAQFHACWFRISRVAVQIRRGAREGGRRGKEGGQPNATASTVRRREWGDREDDGGRWDKRNTHMNGENTKTDGLQRKKDGGRRSPNAKLSKLVAAPSGLDRAQNFSV